MKIVEVILERLFPPRPELLAEASRGRRVLVRGRVVGRDLLAGPVSGASCVYYDYAVQKWSPTVGSWLVIERDEAIAEFYVQDESGRAVVSPHDVHVELPPWIRRTIEPGDGVRRVEAILRPGDLVDVTGAIEEVVDIHDETRGYRDEPARWMIRAFEGHPLAIRAVRSGAP